jgi:hypothetical protein
MIKVCKVCGETNQHKLSSNGVGCKRNLFKVCDSVRCKNNYHKLKQLVFDNYGRVCVWCGERHIEFLSIDHINDDGNIHRKNISHNGGNQQKMYRDIISEGFPKDRYQILCYNCNMAKHTHKYNPLHIERELSEQVQGFMGEGI